MRLFYITASFPFGIGESFLIPEIEAFKKQGVNLCIIPVYPRGDLREDWKNISLNYKLFPEKILSLKILWSSIIFALYSPRAFYKHLKLLKGSNCLILAKNLVIIPKSIWLKSIIDKEKPDHIHVHWGSTTSTAVMLATFDKSIPWSITCHRWDIYENNLLTIKSKKSNFIRFISEKGRTDAIKNGVSLEKSFVIHLGTKIPDHPYYPTWEKDASEFVIICPANLIPVKGHAYLIEAINKLIKKNYNIKLLLAGEGRLKDEITKQVKKIEIGNHVTFLGQLSHTDLLNLYKEAKISLMVLPSVDLGNGEHEGVPVSLMEAMSYGVPVLSTNTGSINELLPLEYGFTVPDKDSDALAQWIENVYDNPKLYQEISLTCRNIIEKNWDVNISVKKLINIIDN